VVCRHPPHRRVAVLWERPYDRLQGTRSRPRDGRIIETVGRYNPQTEPSSIALDGDRARHWLERGAQPTDQVRKLLRTQGVP